MFNIFFTKLTKSNKTPKDPVCGMRATDEITFEDKGQIYAFCSDYCRQQFQQDPERYLVKEKE